MRILLGSSILLSLEYYLKHPDLLIAAVPGATLNYNIYSQFFKNVAANTVTHVYLILCGGNNLWRGKIEREGTKKDYVVHYHRTKYRESSTEVCSKFVVLVNQLKQKFKNAEFCIVPPLGRWCLEEWFSQRTVCDECIIFKQPFSELVDLELKLRKEIGHFCRMKDFKSCLFFMTNYRIRTVSLLCINKHMEPKFHIAKLIFILFDQYCADMIQITNRVVLKA